LSSEDGEIVVPFIKPVLSRVIHRTTKSGVIFVDITKEVNRFFSDLLIEVKRNGLNLPDTTKKGIISHSIIPMWRRRLCKSRVSYIVACDMVYPTEYWESEYRRKNNSKK
jgi:hypothetical protein